MLAASACVVLDASLQEELHAAFATLPEVCCLHCTGGGVLLMFGTLRLPRTRGRW